MAKLSLLTSSLLAISIALTGCGGGSDSSNATPPPAQKNLRLAGTVVDHEGKALSDVSINIGSQTLKTNTRGEFTLSLDSSSTHLTALFKKAGYLTTARQIPVVEMTGKSLTLNISLSPDQVSQQFAANTGISKLDVSGATVSIPANAIVRSDGTAFTGQVQLAANYYNPDSLAGAQAFAQPFAGENPNGSNRTGLITMGVVEVKLSDPVTGEKLQLKTGQSATLSFPAASTARNLTTIPLWYYDETKKIWVKEGQVTRQADGSYQGTVQHFTLWNVDIPVDDGAKVTGCFEDAVSKKRLSLFFASIEARGFSTNGGVGADGQFTAVVPANTPLTLLTDLPMFGSFSPVTIPSLSPNQTFNLNNGKCIPVTPPSGTDDPVLTPPFPVLPPTPTPTPTPTGEIIGYNFIFITDEDDDDVLSDVVLMTLRLSQANGSASIAVSGTSLYNKPVNFGGNSQYASYSLTTQGIALSGETRIQNGQYQQTLYGTSFANNQYTQRLSNGYQSTSTLSSRTIAGQNMANRLRQDGMDDVPDVAFTAFNQLPANQRTFSSNTNCLMTASSTSAIDAIEFDTAFSIPLIGQSFDAFGRLMIPSNRIAGVWRNTAWVASSERDADNTALAYVQYQNSVYSGSYEFAGTTTAENECIWYNAAAKDQMVNMIRAAYPTL